MPDVPGTLTQQATWVVGMRERVLLAGADSTLVTARQRAMDCRALANPSDLDSPR